MAAKHVTLLSLRRGRLAVDLAPEVGGSIARFAVDNTEVLRPGVGVNGACYPLVPFSNRIANGRLDVEGKTFLLEPNWPGQRHPMHGDGWARAWTTVTHDETSAEIAYDHDGRDAWPFRYCARQHFRLEAHSLTVSLSIENRERHAVPAGLGLHPFFVREPDSELFFHADTVWLADGEVLPTHRVAVPLAWDFSHGRPAADAALDNCFEGWEGDASVIWPSRRLRLALRASEVFRHLVVYTPPGRSFFCVEPVSHANGQIGRTRLAAGATLGGEIVFHVSDL